MHSWKVTKGNTSHVSWWTWELASVWSMVNCSGPFSVHPIHWYLIIISEERVQTWAADGTSYLQLILTSLSCMVSSGSKVIGMFRETFVFFSSVGNQSLGFFPWCWSRKNTEACLHSWLSPSFASETPDTLSLCTSCLLNTGPDSQFVFDILGLFSSVNNIYV